MKIRSRQRSCQIAPSYVRASSTTAFIWHLNYLETRTVGTTGTIGTEQRDGTIGTALRLYDVLNVAQRLNGLNVLNDLLLTGTTGTFGTEQSDGTTGTALRLYNVLNGTQ
jgi:hypothetical protein